VPRYQYPYSYRVTVTGGTYHKDVQNQRLTYVAQAGEDVHRVLIEPI
jgi:hypothetical protein